MKKLMSLLLVVLILALAVAACSPAGEGTTDPGGGLETPSVGGTVPALETPMIEETPMLEGTATP